MSSIFRPLIIDGCAGQHQTLQGCCGAPVGQAASSGSQVNFSRLHVLQQTLPLFLPRCRRSLQICRQICAATARQPQQCSSGRPWRAWRASSWPQRTAPAHRSLEVLRLEDPATMFGCWNPGCAAAFAIAGDGRLLKFIHLLALVHVHKPADMQHAGMLICMMSADRGKC